MALLAKAKQNYSLVSLSEQIECNNYFYDDDMGSALKRDLFSSSLDISMTE